MKAVTVVVDYFVMNFRDLNCLHSKNAQCLYRYLKNTLKLANNNSISPVVD